MDWDSKLCYKLIDEYGLDELLWNTKNPLYFLKYDAWCSISRNLDKSIEEIKKKILSLTLIN